MPPKRAIPVRPSSRVRANRRVTSKLRKKSADEPDHAQNHSLYDSVNTSPPNTEPKSSLSLTQNRFLKPVVEQDGFSCPSSQSHHFLPQTEKGTGSETTINIPPGLLSSLCTPRDPGIGQYRPIEQCLPDLQTMRRSPSPKPKRLGDTSYNYEKLNPGGEQIRLLQILPNESVIECKMTRAWLNNPPDYIAISYAWGDPTDTRYITLEGHEFPITVSLWQILDRLRSEHSAVTVWADAICINQTDLNERRQQVQEMTRIYNSATSVAAWLGPDYDNSHLAIEFLQELLKTNEANPTNCDSIIQSVEWIQHIIALSNVLEREYWFRLWTTQELFNARHVVVYYGSTKLPWLDLLTATDILRRYRGVAGVLYNRVTKSRSFLISTLCWGQHTCIPHKEVSLHEGILLTNEKLCKDPLDKIYGILGLLPSDERDRIPADYTLSKQQVYTTAVRHVITTTRKLDIIVRPIHDCCALQVSRGTPTWLPDFSRPREIKPLVRWSCSRASRGTHAAVSIFAQDRKLEALAVSVGTLKTTTSCLPTLSSRGDVIPVFLKWCAAIEATFGFQHCRKHLQALCRLLYELNLSESRPAWVDDEAWMNDIFGTLQYFLEYWSPGYVMDQQWESLASLDSRKVYNDIAALQVLHDAMLGRQFCITAEGLLVLTSGRGQPGDNIYVMLGASVPVVLRNEGTEYMYVGEACVDRYMGGRAIDEVESGHRQVESIVLI